MFCAFRVTGSGRDRDSRLTSAPQSPAGTLAVVVSRVSSCRSAVHRRGPARPFWPSRPRPGGVRSSCPLAVEPRSTPRSGVVGGGGGERRGTGPGGGPAATFHRHTQRAYPQSAGALHLRTTCGAIRSRGLMGPWRGAARCWSPRTQHLKSAFDHAWPPAGVAPGAVCPRGAQRPGTTAGRRAPFGARRGLRVPPRNEPRNSYCHFPTPLGPVRVASRIRRTTPFPRRTHDVQH
jgi:hypothetical protein